MRPRRKRINPTTGKGKRWDAILRRLPQDKELIGAEIGVWQGKTSFRLLAARPKLKLIMVDPWIVPKKESTYYKTGDDNARKTKQQHNKDYRTTMKKVAFAGNRAKIMKMSSQKAAELVKEKSLDFVFIDGDHSYAGVKLDCILWIPKIKKGGFICSHDYAHPRLPGVKKAIDELFNPKEIKLDVNRTVFIRV